MATPEQQAYTKRWREKNKEYDKARKKKYHEENRDAQLKKHNTYYYKNVTRRMVKSAQGRAIKLGLPFDLTMEDIVVPAVCPYFGTPLDYSGGKETVPSLERVNSTLGYTRDNVIVISYLANTMKNDATDEQLRTFAEAVLRMH